MREIATVEHEVVDLLASDRVGEVGGRGLDLGHRFTGNFDDLGDSTNGELDVDARFLGDIQHDAAGGVFGKALCRNNDVVGSARETGDHVSAVRVCVGRSS